MSKWIVLALAAAFGTIRLALTAANPPVDLQPTSPGVAQSGHLNIAGTATVGLLKSQGTVFGSSTAPTGYAYGGFFTAASNQARGFYGYASSKTGLTYGGFFQNASESGRAVYGLATATTGFNYGGYFQTASSGGRGLLGVAAAPSGTTYGVYGSAVSPNGYGVYSDGNMAASGVISGNGGGLTNLNASNLSSGTIANARLPVPLALSSNIDDPLISATTYSATGAAVRGNASYFPGAGIGGEFVSSAQNGFGLIARNPNAGLAFKAFGRSEFDGQVCLLGVSKLGIGQSFASFPLDFADVDGDKISLYGSAAASHFGLGVKSSSLRMFAADATSSVAIGRGGATSFFEWARFTEGPVLQFWADGQDLSSTIRNSYDIRLEHDFDNDNSASWIRFYTNANGVEQLRMHDGDEADALFDGAVVANGIDFAEAFKVQDSNLEPGDLVVNHGSDWESVMKSTHAYDQGVIGVVSTKPAFVAGMSFNAEDRMDPDLTARRDEARRIGDLKAEKELTMQMRELVERSYRPVAFMGRVPVKVAGAVKVGDHLTASNIPGVAMAMTRPGQSIGIALESNISGNAKILAMVQPGFYAPLSTVYGGEVAAELGKVLAKVDRLLAENESLRRDVADLRARLERLERATYVK